MERVIKVFVDGFGDMDIVDVQCYVTKALEEFGLVQAYKGDPFYKGLRVKRVTIGADTFINPDFGKED